jgi:hypothetical protein
LTIIFASIFISASTLFLSNRNAAADFSWKLFLPSLFNSSAVLSPAQEAFVKLIGYPQQFTKTFSYENGIERVDECWVYTEHKVVENFINGIFVSEKVFSSTYPKTNPQNKPQQFSTNTKIPEIISRYGQPSITKQEDIWNGTLITYGFPSLYVVFNNDQIVSVTSLK